MLLILRFHFLEVLTVVECIKQKFNKLYDVIIRDQVEARVSCYAADYFILANCMCFQF